MSNLPVFWAESRASYKGQSSKLKKKKQATGLEARSAAFVPRGWLEAVCVELVPALPLGRAVLFAVGTSPRATAAGEERLCQQRFVGGRASAASSQRSVLRAPARTTLQFFL